MPVFTPITKAEELPADGKGYETFTQDLKLKLDGTGFEHAKDMVAFANHLGGNIIVGIAEAKGLASQRMPMDDANANLVERAYRDALDLCHPQPVINCEKVGVDGGLIVVVNVWPYPNQAIGVRLKERSDEDFGGGSYVFPVRAGTKTSYIAPENLRMFMSPEVRRVVVLLAGIPEGAHVELTDVASTAATLGIRYRGVCTIDEAKNRVTFPVEGQTGTPRVLCLDDIFRVYEERDKNWIVAVKVER